MDFLNNDCAPDLMRFLQVRIGEENGCYYAFLQGIEEKNLPLFSDEQIAFIKYCSSLLPLVRPHEYVMIQVLLNGALPMAEISNVLYSKVPRCTQDEIKHTIKFMLKKSAVKEEVGKIYLNTNLDEQFREYTEDLLAYGMTQYE